MVLEKLWDFLFTGKGEPTLFPGQLEQYLDILAEDKYKSIKNKELQTNGLNFQQDWFRNKNWLETWHEKGLDTICLSVVDVDQDNNQAIYIGKKEYPLLEDTIQLLHDYGYSVRLSVTMFKGVVDGPEDLERLVDYCLENKVEQLTVRPVRQPENSYCQITSKWVIENELSLEQEKTIADYLSENATPVKHLMHGAIVYDYRGQNLCLSDCLTESENGYESRQLIFNSNGRLAKDWTGKEGIIWRGKNE